MSAKAAVRGRRLEVDMTRGSAFRHILNFALPLLVGNIFQQLYNMVDTWVVGNYVSSEAFSAVGSVGPIINTLIGFFTGLASGAGAVISQYYGAKDEEQVGRTVHTAVLLTLLLGVLFTGVGIGFTPLMLRLMNTPAEVMGDASLYLTIYFAGILGLMVYNMGAGILRAVGDSRRPFYFLVVCAVLNTVLDLYFVLRLGMGVEGVALATIIAQFISAILVIIVLMRSSSCVKLTLRRLRLHGDMLKMIFRVGLPAGLQMAVTSFSNVFVQSYINQFGATCMSGWTAYNKVDQLAILPMQSISMASTTFVAQNLGAAQEERARRGLWVAQLMTFVCTAFLSVLIVIFAPGVVAFFNGEPQVVRFGTMFLRWLTPFYVLCGFNQIFAGALRGAGNSRAPMIIMLCSFVVFRQVYLFVMSRLCNEIIPIAMGYPAGWLVCSAAVFLYYRKVGFSRTTLLKSAKTE